MYFHNGYPFQMEPYDYIRKYIFGSTNVSHDWKICVSTWKIYEIEHGQQFPLRKFIIEDKDNNRVFYEDIEVQKDERFVCLKTEEGHLIL